jgi:hypothetical protein
MTWEMLTVNPSHTPKIILERFWQPGTRQGEFPNDQTELHQGHLEYHAHASLSSVLISFCVHRVGGGTHALVDLARQFDEPARTFAAATSVAIGNNT